MSFGRVRGKTVEELRDDNALLQWESAHVCPKCGFSVGLKNLGLRVGATGVVTCPKCDWSGPVEIGVVMDRATSG